jgi:hypothetical protein
VGEMRLQRGGVGNPEVHGSEDRAGCRGGRQ